MGHGDGGESAVGGGCGSKLRLGYRSPFSFIARFAELLEQARALSGAERKDLVKLLLDTLDAPALPQAGHRRIAELRGLGKEIWAGIDAQQYVDELRSEWDRRP